MRLAGALVVVALALALLPSPAYSEEGAPLAAAAAADPGADSTSASESVDGTATSASAEAALTDPDATSNVSARVKPDAPGMWRVPAAEEIPPPKRQLRVGICISIPSKKTSMYTNGANSCGLVCARELCAM